MSLRSSAEAVKPVDEFDVVIVGGGYAGVAAAIALGKRGRRVALIEARDQVGGRAWTKVMKNAPDGRKIHVDMGAGLFGPMQRRLTEVIKSLDDVIVTDLVKWAGPDAFDRFYIGFDESNLSSQANDAMFGLFGLGNVGADLAMVQILRSLIKVCFLESLVNLDEPWNTPFARWLDSLSCEDFFEKEWIMKEHKELWTLAPLGINSIYPEEVSLLYFIWYHATNGGILMTAQDFQDSPQNFCVSPGFGRMAKIWLEKEGQNITVFTGRAATEIETMGDPVDFSRRGKVRVLTQRALKKGEVQDEKTPTDERVFIANEVVVATSFMQWKNIKFSPPLKAADDPQSKKPSPETSRSLLSKQIPGHAMKAVFRYQSPWWMPDRQGKYMHNWATGSHMNSIVEWALDVSRPTEKFFGIMLFISPDCKKQAKQKLKERNEPEDEESLNAVMKDLIAESFVLMAKDANAADVYDYLIVDWPEEPYIGTGPNGVMKKHCISRWGELGGDPLRSTHGPHKNIWFAGSELSASFMGYLEGAIRSGESVAARIVDEPLPKYNDEQRKTAWFGVIFYGILFLILTALGLVTLALQMLCLDQPFTGIQKILTNIYDLVKFIWDHLIVNLLKLLKTIVKEVIKFVWKGLVKLYNFSRKQSHNELYALQLLFFQTIRPVTYLPPPHVAVPRINDIPYPKPAEEEKQLRISMEESQTDCKLANVMEEYKLEQKQPPPSGSLQTPSPKVMKRKSKSTRRPSPSPMKSLRKLRGLVLSGGGAFGAYQASVILELASQGKKWDFVSGVSVGALNGSIFAMYGKDYAREAAQALLDIWRSLKGTQDVLGQWPLREPEGLLFQKGIMNYHPLEGLLHKVMEIGGMDHLRESDVEFTCGATCIETGEYFDIPKSHPKIEDFILASAAEPFFMEAREILGKHYFDGGVRCVVPVAAAIDYGCEEIDIITVHAERINPWVPEDFNSLELAIRTVDIMANSIAQDDLAKTELYVRLKRKDAQGRSRGENAVKDTQIQNLKTFIYSPSRFLGLDFLDFSTTNIAKYITQGRKDITNVKSSEMSDATDVDILNTPRSHSRSVVEIGIDEKGDVCLDMREDDVDEKPADLPPTPTAGSSNNLRHSSLRKSSKSTGSQGSGGRRSLSAIAIQGDDGDQGAASGPESDADEEHMGFRHDSKRWLFQDTVHQVVQQNRLAAARRKWQKFSTAND
jgi:predicted acylesterase/phospholipase RssA